MLCLPSLPTSSALLYLNGFDGAARVSLILTVVAAVFWLPSLAAAVSQSLWRISGNGGLVFSAELNVARDGCLTNQHAFFCLVSLFHDPEAKSYRPFSRTVLLGDGLDSFAWHAILVPDLRGC